MIVLRQVQLDRGGGNQIGLALLIHHVCASDRLLDADVWHKGPGEQAGADPYNQDLWYHSTAVGHETRMYLDNSPEWDHILDIAAFGHEAQLSKYHRPGSMAFLDMLEVRNRALLLYFVASINSVMLYSNAAYPPTSV